jgi:hypothetical protein
LLTLLQLLDLTQKKVDLKIVLRRRWRIHWVLIGIDWRGRRIGVKGLGYRSDKGSKRWKILDLWQLLFLPCLFRLMISTLCWREIASGSFSLAFFSIVHILITQEHCLSYSLSFPLYLLKEALLYRRCPSTCRSRPRCLSALYLL